jgi:uncharacterized RDD family membrane protein YckC
MQSINLELALPYASPWKRLVAYLIDWLIIGAVSEIIDRFLLQLEPLFLLFLFPALIFILFFATWFYFAKMESSRGATIGKSIMKISVADTQGGQISFGRASGRYFAKVLSAIPLCAGYVMAFFTDKKQCLHDILAGTVVIDSAVPLAAPSLGSQEIVSIDAEPPPKHDPSLLLFGQEQGGEMAMEPPPAASNPFGEIGKQPPAETPLFSPQIAVTPDKPTEQKPAETKERKPLPRGMFPCPSCGTAAGQFQTKCMKCGTKLTPAMFKQYLNNQ